MSKLKTIANFEMQTMKRKKKWWFDLRDSKCDRCYQALGGAGTLIDV